MSWDDGLFAFPRHRRPLHRERRRFVQRPLDECGPSFEVTEETFDEEGLETVAEHAVHHADCEHLVYQPGAITARCALTGKWLCWQCTVRCSRCFRIISPERARVFQAIPYCPWCRIIVACQRCILRGLASLHGLLSKEFN